MVSTESPVFVCLLLDVGNLWIFSHTSNSCRLVDCSQLTKNECDLCLCDCLQYVFSLFLTGELSGMHP